MKLYEVNQEIESIFEQMVDSETGEILEASDELMTQLDSLQMERDRILEYLAKLVLNTRSDATALKEEELRLKKRRETLSKKEERIMDILDRECGGVKTDLGVATLSYRKTEKIEVSDLSAAIEWFKSKGLAPVAIPRLRLKDFPAAPCLTRFLQQAQEWHGLWK